MKKLMLVVWNRLMIWLCGDSLWDMARAWVRIYEDKEIPSEEKRERVTNMVRVEAQTLGMEIATSLVNFIIESALQYLRQSRK